MAKPVPGRVVFLVDNLERPNGIVSSVLLLAAEWRRQGTQVELWTFRTSDADVREDFEVFDALPGYRLTTFLPGFATSREILKSGRRLLTVVWWPWAASRMRRRALGWGEDTLVIGAGLDAVHTVWRAGLRPEALVSQVHSSVSALSPQQVRNVKGAAAVSRLLTALTEPDARELGSWGIAVVAMPNPVRLLSSWAEPGRARVVVYAGRLVPEKQVDHLIRAFATVATSPWVLKVYGSGPEEARLRELAREAGASVEFCGVNDDMAAVMQRAAIHVLPSRAEGLPMSVLEAASAGVPTLAYPASPGTVEAVAEGGLLVPQNDEAALAGELARLMSDPELRVVLGGRAKEHAASYRAAAVVERWRDLWIGLGNE